MNQLSTLLRIYTASNSITKGNQNNISHTNLRNETNNNTNNTTSTTSVQSNSMPNMPSPSTNNMTLSSSPNQNVFQGYPLDLSDIAPDAPVFSEAVEALLPNRLKYPFFLPPLNYAYDALEPFIDAKTMRIHHNKHHQKYIDELNLVLTRYPELANNYTLGQMLTFADRLPSDVQRAIINNGGGHYNHSFFWDNLTPPSPDKENEPVGELAIAIENGFGSFNNFKAAFKAAALSVFGSGYAWLVKIPSGRLQIITTQNQITTLPLRAIPLVGIDVWEHAYYLKHQNERDAYIDNWFNVINWDYANDIYKASL